MSRLAGRRVIVVGGTGGIGLAVAAALRRDGATVVIAGRRPDGRQTASGIGAEFVAMDILDPASVSAGFDAAADCLGGLDVAVLNAGVAQPIAGIGAISEQAVREVVDTNLLGNVWCLRNAARLLSDGGSIIVTSSVAAVTGLATEAVYAATKAALAALVRCTALELGPRGIRVNAVQPGAVETDMNQMPEALFAVIAPLGRKGRVEDLTGLYCYLASDESGYLTGQGITVDGGLSLGTAPTALRAASGYAKRLAAQAEAGQPVGAAR